MNAVASHRRLLSAEGVDFGYAPTGDLILRDINLEVRAGERICLWGPSGSGKSTLLALLGRLVQPRSGTVDWDEDLEKSAVPVGWIVQTANLISSLSARENIVLGGLIAGLSAPEGYLAADQFLARMNLDAIGGQRADHLSGGQAQRTVIGRAVVSGAPLVLADEPTGQLDAESTAEVCSLLFGTDLHERALVIASHDRNVADRCDSVLEIVKGRLVQS